ncbi:MAG: ABC transporter permease [Bryobacter sp.]|nr:ABC transporter permease [Bryobacter sp.]
MLLLLRRLILRPALAEPGRTLLTLFSIAIGVAVIFAMDLAGNAATTSFRSSLEVVGGEEDIEITAVGGVPVEVLGRLNELPYALKYSPRVEDFVWLNEKRTVPLVGLDLVSTALEAGNQKLLERPEKLDLGRRAAFVSKGLARAGEVIAVQVNDTPMRFVVAGIFDTGDVRGDLVVLDIEDAEAVTGRANRLDRILVTLPKAEEDKVDVWVETLRGHFGGSLSIRPVGARKEENRKMLAAFRWNLKILSYIALLVGAFLIYNTISVSVVRRRGEIGILRALGGTRAMVRGGFLAEAALFGLVGGVIGLAVGRVLAEGAVLLVGLTVEALYVSSTPAPVRFEWGAALLSLLTGVATSVLAALAPALEAGQVPPTEAMARGRVDTLAREGQGRYLLYAAGLAVVAALLSQLPPIARLPLGGYTAVLALVGSAAFLAPAFVTFGSKLLEGRLGVMSLLAGRSLSGALRRSAVLVATLATAAAMMTSVGIMVGSFRETMLTWLDTQIRADFYLRPAGSAAIDRHPTIAEAVADEIERIPGVEAVDRFRAYSIRYGGLPATLAAGDVRAQMRYGRTSLYAGNMADALQSVTSGEGVIISEPFSEKHRLRVNDRIRLPIGAKEKEFRVAGIFLDYSSENGYVVLDRNALRQYLPDDEPSNLAVYLKASVSSGSEREAVRRQIEAACGPRRIAIFENSSLRAEAVRIFDQTFAVTYALEAIAIFVAIVGVAGAMLALIIDRRREIGLLRFLGGSRGQVQRLVLLEAGFLGLFSQILGMVAGAFMSLILIFVINKQSFGWTIQFDPPVAALLGASLFVWTCTVLAGFYPARVATNLNPIEVMHEE